MHRANAIAIPCFGGSLLVVTIQNDVILNFVTRNLILSNGYAIAYLEYDSKNVFFIFGTFNGDFVFKSQMKR